MPEQGFLTTHILDTALGKPAAGIAITLFKVNGSSREKIAEAVTNDDGRTNSPILPKETFETGQYELVFHAGDYLRQQNTPADTPEEPLFLDQIPIRFGINDATSHYHVPLLLSPYGYSTYRGS